MLRIGDVFKIKNNFTTDIGKRKLFQTVLIKYYVFILI